MSLYTVDIWCKLDGFVSFLFYFRANTRIVKKNEFGNMRTFKDYDSRTLECCIYKY